MARIRYSDEKRELRISLLVTKTFYDQINLLAYSQSQTTNDFIVRQMEKIIAKNMSVIDKFKAAKQAAQSEFVELDGASIE